MNFFSAYPRSTIAALVLLLSFALFSFFRSGGIPSFVKDDLNTIHKNMVRQAEQLAGTLESSSRVVVLEVDYAMEAHGDRVYERVFDALKAKGLDIQHVERLIVDAESGWDPNQSGFPYSEFVRVVGAIPDVDAVIALCGPPYGLEQFRSIHPSTKPKLLVAGGIGGGVAESLCKQGWLHAATVPRTVTENGELVLKFELVTGR